MSEWMEYKLGDITKWFSGGTPSKKNEAYWSGHIPWISAKTLTDYRVFNSELNITEEALQAGSRLAKVDDILLLVRGSGLFNNISICLAGKPVAFNQDIKAIRAIDPKLQEFVYFWLYANKKTLDDNLEETGIGAGKFDTKMLQNLLINIPKNVEYRNQLVGFSRAIFDKIDLLHRQNKTLEALAQTLFRHWFIDGADDDWEVVTVGDFTKINASTVQKDYKHNLIEYLDTGSITEGKIEGFQQYALKDAPSRAKRLVKHNDVIYSTVRPNQKHYGIIKHPQPNLVVSTGFSVLTCDKIDPHFVYILLTQSDMTEYLHSVAEGSTSTYPSLKPSDLASVEFQLPPKEKLEDFSKLTHDSWAKIDFNQNQIRTLEKLRDTLLPKLMSGEVRVRL